MNRTSEPRFLSWCVAALALAACDDPLSLPQRIERTRVLAARVESATDPSSAWPAPGSGATARWLVVDPAVDAGFTWDLRACVTDEVNLGLPSCVRPPFASALQAESSLAVPNLAYETPATGIGAAVLLHGVICSGGIPNASATGCEGAGADGDAVVLTIPLGANSGNTNPSLADDTILFDGEPWTASDPTGIGCGSDAGNPAPRVVAPSTGHGVTLRLRGDRDRVDSDALTHGSAGTWETLQVAYAASAGTLNRPYDFVEPGDSFPEQVRHVHWEAPAPNEPVRVRIYIVLRDLRGGSDWIRRDVCVVPSA